MKLSRVFLTVAFILFGFANSNAQEIGETIGGEFVANPGNEPCLTEANYSFYNNEIANNLAALEAAGLLADVAEGASVLFQWPVAQAPGFDYNSTWSISNYVDHDPASGSLEDYNCGTRTYDSGSYDHQGLDIYTWPFWWKQMEDEQSHVVAAAGGQIIYKNDGSFDRNCAFNSDLWNAVYVRHDDGSIAWYGHFKNGSVTSKSVGDFVSTGEYLGVIGSSGNSTGPHLHFEVYDSGSNLIDPYAGVCNDLNASSWWASQKPYANPQINAVLAHNAFPEFNPCPTTEVPHITTEFDVNSTLYFGRYYKDQQPGTSAVNTVLDPSGAVYSTWSQSMTVFYYSSWWVNTITLNDYEGVWTLRVSYNGETVETNFTVSTLSTAENQLSQVQLYPNPAQEFLTISNAQDVNSYQIYEMTGKQVGAAKNVSLSQVIDIRNLATGLYFIRLTTQEGASKTLRFVKR